MEYWSAFAVMNFAIILFFYLIQSLEIDFKNKKIYMCYFVGVILLILNFEFCTDFLRIVMNFLIFVFLAYLLFDAKIKKAFILGTIMIAVSILSEFIYVGLTYQIIEHNLFVENSSLFVLFQNTIIGIIMLIIGKIIKKFKFYEFISNKLARIGDRQIVIFSLLTMVIFNFIVWIMYFASSDLYNNPILSFIGSIISLFCLILVYSYLKANNKYLDITEKYNLSLENIRDQEQVIENNRINNHEIRNQFLMLRSMSKNKKVNTYIDTILDNKITDDEQLLIDVSKIPGGGLRGLIYTKLLSMKEKNIDYDLHVEKGINMKRFSQIESCEMVDICKIIGVFLDNAIEAVENLDEKTITIEMYLDKKDIVISITNNFIGYIDMENIDKAGFTTKHKGHGYGLKVVDDIIKKNDKLENFKELYEDNFSQNLKIKM